MARQKNKKRAGEFYLANVSHRDAMERKGVFDVYLAMMSNYVKNMLTMLIECNWTSLRQQLTIGKSLMTSFHLCFGSMQTWPNPTRFQPIS